eukprot:1438753-Lingulodinium_polyedra.AAC.1
MDSTFGSSGFNNDIVPFAHCRRILWIISPNLLLPQLVPFGFGRLLGFRRRNDLRFAHGLSLIHI